MNAPLLVVTGTGTEIGKTHVAAALLVAWARALAAHGDLDPQVLGLKPVESGVSGELGEDGRTLEQLSTFHVKRFPAPYLLKRAVSPHLAARDEGRTVDLQVILDHVAEARGAGPSGVVVELAGGLFSPLARALSNADVARALQADAVVLVAPDRLGVLHDLGAATRAAEREGLALRGIILVTPAAPDLSTGTNAFEVSLVTEVPLLAVLPRAPVVELGVRADLGAVVQPLLRTPARRS
ncbi:dethiobiotin synthase [soil metagenome]